MLNRASMRRCSVILAALLLAPAAWAGERSTAFTIAVTVVRPLVVRGDRVVPAAHLGSPTGTGGGAGRSPAATTLVTLRDGVRLVTVFPDGAPTALIER